MLTTKQIVECIDYSRNSSDARKRELIDRAFDFGNGTIPADPFKLREVLQQTACLCAALMSPVDPIETIKTNLNGDYDPAKLKMYAINTPEPELWHSIPAHWLRTTRAPFTVDGMEFRTYRIGINQYATVANHIVPNYVCWNGGGRSTYYAKVGEDIIGDKYRTQTAALKAVRLQLSR